MRVIGIDTASTTASVALVEDGLLLSEKTDLCCDSNNDAIRRPSKSNHAETIVPLIELLFESTGLSLQDVAGFALSNGPGSFTGLRIGLSTVKGLAYGSKIPVVAISTLFAHAARVRDYDGLICAFLDARKNEVYAAVFQKSGEVINRVTEDAVASAASVIETVRGLQRDRPCLFVGDGATVYKKLLWDLSGIRLHDATTDLTIAATVARLAEDRFRSNEVDDLGTLTPVYVRPSEAEFKRTKPDLTA
jgi:tRNA threonylcarbamoyladenosine biosynthesis protein TsaB